MKDPDRAGVVTNIRVCIGEEFGLPQSVVEQIKSSYQSTTQRKDAYLDAYTHRHPCPSWRKVVYVLRVCFLHHQAEQVENTYVQGMFDWNVTTSYMYLIIILIIYIQNSHRVSVQLFS